MEYPWSISHEATARECVVSKDPLAFSPMERISAIVFLNQQLGLSDRAIATFSGLSPSSIRHHFRIAKKLNPDLFHWLHEGKLSFGHAKLIAGIPQRKQASVAQQCIERRWPISTLRKFLAGETAPSSNLEIQNYYQQLSNIMSEQLGFPVKLTVKGQGPQGKIEIQYFTLEDFENLCQRFQITLDNL